MSPRLRPSLALLPLTLLACAAPSSAPINVAKVPVAGSPQRGPADAWVTVVEFGDFECSYCRLEEPRLTAVNAAYTADTGEGLRIVWKHLPLTRIHPHAQAAALAGACADAQGKFWEMHDLMIAGSLDDASLLGDAQAIGGLDVPAWQTCLGSSAPASQVSADVALGMQVGVTGTPTLFVNGVEVPGGAVSEGTLRAAVDQARATAIASGIPKAEYYDRAVLGR